MKNRAAPNLEAQNGNETKFAQFRSRLFDYWSDLLPVDVARQQVTFEIGEMLCRARHAGAQIEELEKHLGISRSWLYLLFREHRARHNYRAPVDVYLSKLRSDLFRLSKKRPWSMFEIDSRAKRIQRDIDDARRRLEVLNQEFGFVQEFRVELQRVEQLTPALKIDSLRGLYLSNSDAGADRAVPVARAFHPPRPSGRTTARKRAKVKALPFWLDPTFPEPKRRR